MDNLTAQLTDIIMAIIQDTVDKRIEQKIADLQDGINVAAFDINIVEEDLDIADKVQDALNVTTFTVTVD